MDAGSVSRALDGIMEQLAALEHERWAHWQRHMHGKALKQPDGSMVVPAEFVAQWESQIARPSEDLSETEKESDREQVRKYLPTIVASLSDS